MTAPSPSFSLEFPMNQLPDEVLLEIFHRLPFKDQMELCLVCKQWCKLLSLHSFKRSIVFDEFYPYHLENICGRSFHEITITDHFSNVEKTKRKKYLDFMGHKTEVIRFSGNVFASHFDRDMLMDLPQLNRVEFNDLDQLIYFNIPSTVRKVHIKNFDPQLYFDDAQGKLKNVEEVNLEWFEIYDDPYELIKTPQYFKIFSFYEKFKVQRVNLKEPTQISCDNIIDIYDDGSEEPFDLEMASELKKLNNLKSFPLTVKSRHECFFFHQNPGFTLDSICTITLNDCEFSCPQRKLCTNCITNLIRVCPNINSWRIRGNFTNQQELFDSTLQSIRALDIDSDLQVTTLNYPDIEVLRLKNFEIDWSNVSQMSKLKKLFLGNYEITLEQFKILVQKCPSVEHFSFLGGYKKGFIEVMKASWPFLKKIYVHYREVGQPGYCLKGLNSFAVKSDFVTEPAPSYGYPCSFLMDSFLYELCEFE